jgi:hypothetical protein
MKRIDRRALLRGGAATLGAAALAPLAGTGPATAAPAGFPSYTYIGTPFTKSALRYNPTNELIFPCVRGVYDKLGSYRARYYLWYAPHDAPGGICLAYGNSLGGQFTEYPANPIIGNVWSPYYSVSHVSSPHVIWHTSAKRFYLYFHGENTTTRLATSADGITFTYEGVVLSTANIPGSTETSYARVFEHTIAARGSRYVMVFMGVTGGRRDLYWGWSADARTWQFQPTPLVNAEGDGQTDISGPHVLKRNGTTYVVYHGGSGRMYLTEVGNNFDREVHLGVFHNPLTGAPDSGRSAAPAFGTDGGVEYMFYEAGQRSSSTIAVARAI